MEPMGKGKGRGKQGKVAVANQEAQQNDAGADAPPVQETRQDAVDGDVLGDTTQEGKRVKTKSRVTVRVVNDKLKKNLRRRDGEQAIPEAEDALVRQA